MDTFVEVLLWLSLGLLGYAYAGYPVLLWCLSRVTAPLEIRSLGPSEWPTVSVVISAYNEEAVIGRRIENLLEMDYPRELVQILIGSDGSTDATCDVVARYRFAGLQLAAFPVRRGKASVLNDLVSRACGEFVVFTDAATVFYPDALKELMTGFQRYSSASVIVGELEMRSSRSSRNLDGSYWRYELFVKQLESVIGGGLAASGTIYAVRRRDYCPLPSDTIADDLLEPLLIRLRTKGDVVLHATARAWQLIPAQVVDEFHRRVRSGGGIAHALREARSLLLPQWGVVALALWSHKALRLAGPFLLLAALGANLWLVGESFYQLLFAAQAAVYGLGASAGKLRSVPLLGRAASVARYFIVLNAALAVGCVKYALGMASPVWNRTVRTAEQGTAPQEQPRPACRETTREHQSAA